MRYSLLAGGKRIRPVLALATARALGAEPAALPAGRRGDRADPHLLADPRRPAGDGRRRAAARPADLARQVRRGRRDPRRRRPLRRGDPALLRAAGRARPGARRARRAERARPGSTGWSAASTSTSPARRATPRRCGPARAQDRPPDRGQRRRRACPRGNGPNLRQFPIAASPTSSACSSRSSTTSST